MSGPLKDEDGEMESLDAVKQYSNQIIDFLMGFSPNIAAPKPLPVEEEHGEPETTATEL